MASQQSPDGARILVIGAGELGGNVVAALTHRDDAPPVTVLLRPSGTPRHAQLRDQFAAACWPSHHCSAGTAALTVSMC